MWSRLCLSVALLFGYEAVRLVRCQETCGKLIKSVLFEGYACSIAGEVLVPRYTVRILPGWDLTYSSRVRFQDITYWREGAVC